MDRAWVYGLMDRCMSGWMDGAWVYGLMDRCMDG